MAWMTREDKRSHQLILLPRGHQKSVMAGLYAAWRITKNPAIKILYLSSTANLAIKQLKFIKDILTSDIYRYYWPEMVSPEEAKREKWSETEISVDHPLRKAEHVRDPTVFTAGLTTTITGLHDNLTILDDVVVHENAYIKDGREKVEEQYSLLTSIGEGAYEELVVGTRYHSEDLYGKLSGIEYETYDNQGNSIGTEPLFEVFERAVENRGDGHGEFIWPRQTRYDGKTFGFDSSVLSKIKAQYLDQRQFRAQYYNDPNVYEASKIQREWIQYYDPKRLSFSEGRWNYGDQRLNVFAAVDFAFSLKEQADFTSVVVVGVDAQSNYYVLEIDRFKTNLVGDYFKHIFDLHRKWDFRTIRAEVSVGQIAIVATLKNDYIRKFGLALSVDEYRPGAKEGRKEERINAILQPRYQNRQMWHYLGGNCQILEEELLNPNPTHDDVKDALAACVDVCVPPTLSKYIRKPLSMEPEYVHERFGGIV